MGTRQLAVVFALLVGFVAADVYFHNPRGSNNRLNENTRQRKNGNRLFDSQNNARGGYNVGEDGRMYYYGGSHLQLQWTNQHSCGSGNANCEIILQYMCGEEVRDGSNTGTITWGKPDDQTRGMHEDMDYYRMCQRRSRNKGLFVADQELTKEGAYSTRQNPGGTRRGFECPEERDYYPYWAPSPWIDIAVLTNDRGRCRYYQRESQNVKERYSCQIKEEFAETVSINWFKTGQLPINKEECDTYVRKVKGKEENVLAWTATEAHGVDAPECLRTELTRDNHHGNVKGGYPMSYDWTVPDIDAENCVLRLRYNISTKDYDTWTTFAGAEVDLATPNGLDPEDAATRGYVFKNDPTVKVFGADTIFDLTLALNTAQFGRTFQDRSHVFSLRKRPDKYGDAKIHNLNVRGKRGNIVQTYPGVEYDFVPNNLEVAQGDFVHIQWTGSDKNPKDNAGQGAAGTDRHNIVLLDAQQYAEGSGWAGPGGKYGHYGLNYPMHLRNATFLGASWGQLKTLALLDPEGAGGTLDKQDAYFDLEPLEVTSPAGVYQYMCTRNNAFSNRDQKARITVTQGVDKRGLEELADEEAELEDVRELSLLKLLERMVEDVA